MQGEEEGEEEEEEEEEEAPLVPTEPTGEAADAYRWYAQQEVRAQAGERGAAHGAAACLRANSNP
jgi:hypothetical protein